MKWISHPDAIWEPFTRTTGMTREGQQGDPLGGYRPGHGLEHEPVDQAERNSEHTVQHAAFTNTASQIRAALRPGNFSA
jgi:hypothetical protein